MKKLWKRNQIMITALALMIAIAGYLNFMGKQVDEDALFTTSAQFEESDDAVAMQDENQSAKAYDAAQPELALITEDTDDYQALTDIDSMDSDEEMVYSDYLDENEEAVATAAEEGVDEDLVTTGANVADNADLASGDMGEYAKTEMTDDYTGETPGEAVFTSGSVINSIQNANVLKEQTREKNKQALLEIINSETLSQEAKQDAIEQMITMTDITQRECSAQIMLEAKGFEDVVVSISDQQVDVIVATNELTDTMRAQIEDIVSRKTGIAPEHIIISPVMPK